jgi:hypothetical protein
VSSNNARAREVCAFVDHRGEVLQPAHPFKSLRLASAFHVNFAPLFFYLLLLASVSLSLFDLKVACVLH